MSRHNTGVIMLGSTRYALIAILVSLLAVFCLYKAGAAGAYTAAQYVWFYACLIELGVAVFSLLFAYRAEQTEKLVRRGPWLSR